MRKWTKEQINYLKKVSPGRLNKEIATMVNDKFGTNYTASAVSSIKTKRHIHSNASWKSKWTDEVIQFMIDNYKGKDNIELAELLNQKFNLNTTGDRVCNEKTKLKKRRGIDLHTGINRGCIKKGNIPMNKGKKWDEYMSKEGQIRSSKTWYKKGNISTNAVAVGTEKIKYYKNDNLGYIYVKVCDGKKNKNWIPKQRYIYEQHYGPVPEGYLVIFADGNRNNFDIKNLVLISKSENLVLNRNKMRYKDSELTKSSVNVAKLIDKVNKLKHERL